MQLNFVSGVLTLMRIAICFFMVVYVTVALNFDILLVGRICLLNVLSVDVVTSGCR